MAHISLDAGYSVPFVMQEGTAGSVAANNTTICHKTTPATRIIVRHNNPSTPPRKPKAAASQIKQQHRDVKKGNTDLTGLPFPLIPLISK